MRIRGGRWGAAVVGGVALAGWLSGARAQIPPAGAPAVIAAADALFAEASTLRELPILRPVGRIVASRGEIERFAVEKFNAQTTPVQVRAAELTLRALGLAPPDFDYRAFFVELMAEQAAGLYDPGSGRLLLPDWLDVAAQQPVLVHELAHALQDQHFDLRRLEAWPQGESDARLAAHSLVEGDASLAMMQYLLSRPELAPGLLASINRPMPALTRAPAVLRDTLMFPYQQGVQFVSALFSRGGWAAVNAAFAALPASTEQVLHVEKYLAGERPVRVALPEVGRLLGPGWTRLDSDVHGEWGYFLILNAVPGGRDEAARAAAGWAGDRYDLYAGAGATDAALAQMSAWDTDADAQEFLDAYARRTFRRYPDLARQPPAAGRERAVGQSREGQVLVERRGPRVLVLEGVPRQADVEAIARAVWAGAELAR